MFFAAMLTAAPAMATASAPYEHVQGVARMSEDRFWSIIAATLPDATSQRAQIESLTRQLEALSTEDVAAFQTEFDRKMGDAYSWDLWGAAFVIHGGESDDGFDYFRCWLISKGRAFYEAALADPDGLATLLPVDAEGPLEFEGPAYIAFGIWQKRTGLGPKDFPNEAVSAEPKGEPFKESEADLSRRYPKLWARFGHQPLD
jgi:hypothetical protein